MRKTEKAKINFKPLQKGDVYETYLTRLKYLIQQVTNLKQTLVQVLVNLLIGLEVIINAEEFLVTGGSGFIGSHFIDLLLSKNLNVINVDLKRDKLRKKNKNYKFKLGNICNYNFLNKIVNNKIDCIVNFAAQTHVDKSIDFPRDFVQNNILGTFNLLEVIRKKNLNPIFIQISTDEVFGSLSKTEKSFNENSTIKPNSPYSASKASADHLVMSYNKTFNLKTIITHSSNNFGERQHPEKLIPLSIMRLLNSKEIPIYGNGKI